MQESNSQLRIEDVKVTSVEKRKRHGSKNFEFVLSVRWSSGVENIIYRQYSMFFDLQEGLKLILQDKYQVAIPDLPGRRGQIYQRIIRLPSTVSASEIVLKFFSEWGTDAVNNQNQSPNNRTQQARQSKDKHEEHVLDHVTDNVVERYRAVASNENVPEYATVIPKHLRKKRTDALVEDKKEAESVPTVPPPLVNPQDSDGTTIQKSVWQRSRSQGDDGFVGSHGYLNVSHGLDVMKVSSHMPLWRSCKGLPPIQKAMKMSLNMPQLSQNI
ncbi:predicted protein [Nematostella vectensis]|uniref:PX domain-containing protein n=1 Tax=Nematostella vectensis TaxID=45351 RepID=A7RFC3_NEMVE|nr:predicted protein [Nematostella vectensis]|eukprot:XP_001641995.1 predicted protein [Nematostella vectensis]